MQNKIKSIFDRTLRKKFPWLCCFQFGTPTIYESKLNALGNNNARYCWFCRTNQFKCEQMRFAWSTESTAIFPGFLLFHCSCHSVALIPSLSNAFDQQSHIWCTQLHYSHFTLFFSGWEGSVSVIHFDECHSSSIWMLQSTNQLWNHTNAPKLTHLCISRGKNVYNFPFAAWCRELTRRLKFNRRSNKIESEEKSRTKITTMVVNCSKCFSFSLLNPLNFSVRSVPSFSSASRERSSFQSFILSCELAWNTLPILNTWIRFGSRSQFSLAKNCVPTFSSLSFKHGHIFYEHECWCCFFLIW